MKKYLLLLIDYLRSLFSQSHYLFLLLAIPTTLFFIYITPIAWGLDEQVHLARAYQISEGNFYPDKLKGNYRYGGSLPASYVRALDYGWSESNSTQRQEAFYESDRKDIKSIPILKSIQNAPIQDKKKTEYNFGPTGPYAPIVYVPAAIGIKAGTILNLSIHYTVILAKLSQATLYIACVFIALKFLKHERARWIIFIVALLPASIFQVATVNADAFTNAAIFLFLGLVTRALMGDIKMDKKMQYAVGLTSIMVALTKPSYAIFLVLILFIPSKTFGSNKKSYIAKGIILGVSTFLFVLFSIKGLQYSDAGLIYFPPDQAKYFSLNQQIYFILAHPLSFLHIFIISLLDNTGEWYGSVVGILGYNTVRIPQLFLIYSVSVLTIASMYSGKILSKYYSWIMIGLGAGSALAVILLLYASFNAIGSAHIAGVQGRYFIPCIPFIAIGIAGIVPIQTKIEPVVARYLFGLSSTVMLLVASIGYYMALY